MAKTKIQEVIDMENRFEFVEKNGLMQGTRIIVDKETGVQYLLAHWTNVGGLTVLVDKDGKPLLDTRYAKEHSRICERIVMSARMFLKILRASKAPSLHQRQ